MPVARFVSTPNYCYARLNIDVTMLLLIGGSYGTGGYQLSMDKYRNYMAMMHNYDCYQQGRINQYDLLSAKVFDLLLKALRPQSPEIKQ